MKKINFIRLLVLMLVLMTSIPQMWADPNCGFWGDGAASITFKVDGATSKTPSDLNDKNVADYNIGTVTSSLTIETAWVKVWGWNRIGGISLFYRVKEADSESDGSYTPATLGWDNNFNTNDQFWDWGGTNSSPGTLATININLAPGNYEIEFYYQITSYTNGGTSNSSYLNNTNVGNYHANFTIPSKNLTVAGAANGNEVDGSVEGITKGTAYTITATPTAGYAFSSWSATSGSSSITIDNTASATTTVTFNDYANDATVTANFVVESTHNVSVSYKCSSTSIKTGTTESNVGVTTKREITAPTIDHYQFVEWVLGDGVVLADGYDEDNVTIEFNSKDGEDEEDYTLTATYKRLTRFYFANTGNWSKVFAYMWNSNDGNSGDTDNSGWSSNEITSQTKKLCETDIYYFDYDASAHSGWDHIIFHDNGGTPNKTSDLTIADHEDEIYILSSTKWDNINLHTVSVVSEASHQGTVSGGGTASSYGCSPTITATPEPGYRFNGWTVTSGTATIANASSTETTVTASTDATITASFTNDGFVYFDRSAVNGHWSGDKVYMTCLNSTGLWWSSENGGLVVNNWVHEDVHNKEMHRIPNSNIYYYDCTGHLPSKILFTDKTHPHGGGSNFYTLYDMGAVVEETVDLSQDNMFVVENFNWKDKNKVGYCDGFWMKYNDTYSGLEIRFFDAGGSELSAAFSPTYFTATQAGDREFKARVTLSGATTYRYKVKGWNTIWYTNEGTMTNNNCSDWPFYYKSERVGSGNCSFNTTGLGEYTFTLNCTDAGVLRVSLEFPLDVNDYRVVYQGKVKEGTSARAHPSDFIRHLSAEGERIDTISFYVRENWSLQLQKCTGFDGSGNPTWGNVGDPITNSEFEISENGVYTFYVTQNHDGSTNTVTLTKGEVYSGDYYLRSSAAGGGWESYATTPNNKMQYSDYAKAHSGYDYYSCHFANTGKNVKFTIANDYSSCITDTVDNDTYVTSYGNLPYECSVRFMYNNTKNTISRAYLNGSYEGSTEYLAIYAKAGATTDSIKNTDGTAIAKTDGLNRVKFQDLGNWIYQKDIKALPGTHVRLISNYRFGGNDHLQYFKGSAGDWSNSTTEQIIGGTGDWQTLRMVYDFKTNHLVAAWMPPSSNVESALAINADVMIIREEQKDAKQLTFGASGSLSKVDTVYGVMQFNKWSLNNRNKTNTEDSVRSVYARDLYWISFPFDVKLNDVFGFGTYGTHWIIEYYDGVGRATNGFWADSPSNWKFVTPAMRDDFTLEANVGYILALDLENMTTSSSVWENVEDVYLYFPSKNKVGNITKTTATVKIKQDGYECSINRGTTEGDRRIKDSYWHCIGVPSFANNNVGVTTDGSTTVAWSTSALPYIYVWGGYSNPSSENNNTLTPQATSTFAFKAMHAYLVQYSANEMHWSQVSTPSSVAARLTEIPDREFQLALIRENEEQDHTYVRLTDDASVSNRFEFNYDLSKEYNAGRGNIWTVTADTVEVAGNSMPKPLQTTLVPVGVKVVANGDYTLAMPEGTNGEDVFLIDNAYGTRTNLGLMPYTVTLTAGTYEGRFVLEFAPIQDSPTSLENDGLSRSDELNDANDDVRKVFVGGRLYIIRDGKVYDAAGQRIE